MDDRPHRHPPRLRHQHHRLEHRRHRPWPGAFRVRHGLGPRPARRRRGGHFPAAIKTVSEWFPKKERSFATGIFNAGANVGIIITAICVPFIIAHWGWRASFIVTGVVGVFVLFWWLAIYRKPHEHPSVTPAELAHIQQDGSPDNEKPVKWRELVKYRATWAFAIPKFMTDAIWWFYLTWLPTFFNSNPEFPVKVDLKQVGLPFLVIYLVSDFGSIFFGWMATKFIGLAGPSTARARPPCSSARCASCPLSSPP